MRYTALTLSAAIALTGLASPAAAQGTPDQSDVRCLMVLQFIARDPKQSEQAGRGVFYFLGKLAARGPISRVEGILKAEAAKLPPAQAQAELTRCGGELNNRSKEYQAVNQRLAASIAPAGAAPAKK